MLYFNNEVEGYDSTTISKYNDKVIKIRRHTFLSNEMEEFTRWQPKFNRNCDGCSSISYDIESGHECSDSLSGDKLVHITRSFI